jgi:hypothetical protein
MNGGATQQPAELWRGALAKLDSAATIARAARAATTNRAAGDSVLGLALVAAARTALNLNDRARAATYAQQVVDSLPSFEYRAYFTEGIPAAAGFPVNPFWNAMGAPEPVRTGFNSNQSGGINYNTSSLWLVVDSAFIGINDPRVPMTPTRVTTMGGTAAGAQFRREQAAVVRRLRRAVGRRTGGRADDAGRQHARRLGARGALHPRRDAGRGRADARVREPAAHRQRSAGEHRDRCRRRARRPARPEAPRVLPGRPPARRAAPVQGTVQRRPVPARAAVRRGRVLADPLTELNSNPNATP